MRQRGTNVIHWPYRPRPSAVPGVALVHAGGSAVAWVQIVDDDISITSVDPDLIATCRLLMEQREVDTA